MKARVFIVIILTLLFVTCAVHGIAEEYDWPRWRGPNGDGISMETDWNPTALVGGPKILWQVDVGTGYSNVAIKKNRLYTMDRRSVLCFNSETGKEIWKYSFDSFSGPQSTPTIDDKYIYALDSEGVLVCLRAKNGKCMWRKDLVSEYDIVKPHYGFAGSPIVEGDLIILTANTSGIALSKKTGELVWSSAKPPKKFNAYWRTVSKGTDYSTPVIYNSDGKTCATIFSYNGLHCVDIVTGQLLWQYQWSEVYSGRHITDPLIFDNKVFITDFSSRVVNFECVMLDISTNEPRIVWKNQNMGSEISSPVMLDGYIYGCHGGPDMGSSFLRCLNVETGEIMWEKKLGHKTISTAAADEKLIILEDSGTLRIAKATPSSYQEISSCDVFGSEHLLKQFLTPPVLCNGKIYCRNYNGELICIDVSK
jgi:outer membrane protein assembly factor BamB